MRREISRKIAGRTGKTVLANVSTSRFFAAVESSKEVSLDNSIEEFLRDKFDQSPNGALFDDDELLEELLISEESSGPEYDEARIDRTIGRVRGRCKQKVVADLGPLVVPRAEWLDLRGDNYFFIIAESIDEAWNRCIPIVENRPRPTPGYSVGYRRDQSLSSDRRLLMAEDMKDSLGGSLFFVANDLAFPFFCAEAAGGSLNGDAFVHAEARCAECAVIAMRSMCALYEKVRQLHELLGVLLHFSAVYNEQEVRTYGHDASLRFKSLGSGTVEFCRRRVLEYGLQKEKDKASDRWRSNKFVWDLYDDSKSPLEAHPNGSQRLGRSIAELSNEARAAGGRGAEQAAPGVVNYVQCLSYSTPVQKLLPALQGPPLSPANSDDGTSRNAAPQPPPHASDWPTGDDVGKRYLTLATRRVGTSQAAEALTQPANNTRLSLPGAVKLRRKLDAMTIAAGERQS
ncbi:hypothetical protein IWX90DRAFT_300268 [Phyllosticta citrichinensis]|uniref:DUF7924 domain-containing protein n=1 Tax=Phyllosticta citrichinensis TaxID=1130410 RepID=A0ABR1XKV9_9PEZI